MRGEEGFVVSEELITISALNLIYDQTNRCFLSLLEFCDSFGTDTATYISELFNEIQKDSFKKEMGML